MSEFRIDIAPHRRAAARHISEVRRVLIRAFADQRAGGVTVTSVARTLGVHRTILRRELSGRKDISLGRVAEMASVLGLKAASPRRGPSRRLEEQS